MRRHLDLRLASLIVASALALTTPAAGADQLPPQEAPSYTGVYRVSSKSKVNPSDDWKFTSEDTVTIAVLAKESRWDHKADGHTTLIDRVSRFNTTFGGKTAPNTAVRIRAPFVGISWEFGYGTVAAATPATPEVLGTATIAGKECTRIKFTSTQYGTPEFCVTKNGIVLRFANQSSTAEAVYEAESISEETPDKNRFNVPAGYTVQEKSGPRRNVKIL